MPVWSRAAQEAAAEGFTTWGEENPEKVKKIKDGAKWVGKTAAKALIADEVGEIVHGHDK